MIDRRRAVALAVLAGGLLCGATPRSSAQPPVRWELPVGTWLVYERRSAIVGAPTGDAASTREQIQLWRLDDDTDDTRLLLIERTPVTAGRAGPSGGLVLRLSSAGAWSLPEPYGFAVPEWMALVPLLPPVGPPSTQADRWESPPDALDRVWRWSRPASGTLEFTLRHPRGVEAALQRHTAGRLHLTDTAPLAREIQLETRQPHGGRVARWKLHRAGTTSRAWQQRRAAEVAALLRYERLHRAAVARVWQSPSAHAAERAGLQRLWDEALQELSPAQDSPVLRIIRGRRARLATDLAQLAGQATYAARWQDQPARAWSLQDAVGTTRTSEQMRQGWTLEYFWSLSRPESTALLGPLAAWSAAQPKVDQPVTVLGLNVDADPSVARRGLAALELGFPQLIAGPLELVEGRLPLPAYRLIDPAGTVRRVGFGWRPSFADFAPAASAEVGGDR